MSSPTLLANRYRIKSELARGGMGKVLLVEDTHLERELAVKVVLDPDDARLELRFVREAQITGLLNHPLIVPVHELGRDGRQLYLAMPLVRGEELKALIRKLATDPDARAAYGPRRLARIFLKVCEAVAYAHGHGVVHRDIKPSNVMLGEGDEVLLMDWGVARRLDEADDDEALFGAAREAANAEGVRDQQLTAAGLLVGTPAYMPPEQADGVAPDPRLDVYALGSTLYELLTHTPPYGGSAALVDLVLGPPARPRERAPDLEIPPPLESIALKAMAREPEARYRDAAELAADVEAYLDGRAVAAHAEGPLEALRRFAASHRVALTVAGLGLVLLTVAAVAAAAITRQRRTHAQAELALVAAWEEGAQEERAQAEATRQAALRGARRAGRESSVRRSLAHLRQRAREPVKLARLRRDHAQVVKELAAGALEETARDLRRDADRILGEALVGRAPALALEQLTTLELGPERALLRARALWRLERREEALRVVEAARWPAERPDLRLQAAAIRACLTRAPFARRLSALSAAIQGDGQAAWVFVRRAEVLCRLGRFEAAERDYQRATYLQPIDLWIYTSRFQHAAPTYSLGDFRGAQLAIPELVEAAPPQLVAEAWLPVLWWTGTGSNLPEYAARLKPLTLTPLQRARYMARANLIASRYAEAATHARAALEHDPRDLDAQGLLAESLAYAGQHEEAGAIAAKGLARFPEHPRLNAAQGEVLFAAGRHREAIAHFALAARPRLDSDPWRRLAEAYLRCDRPADWEQGVAAAREALARDPFNAFSHAPRARPIPADPRLHRVLGDLRRRQGKLGRAALHYMRAYLHAGWPPATNSLGYADRQDALHLGALHEQLGLNGEALRVYREVAQDPRVGAEARARVARLSGR